jgi:hypothetical protein
MPAPGRGPDGDCFRADIAKVVHTHLNEKATMLVVEWWTLAHGLRVIERWTDQPDSADFSACFREAATHRRPRCGRAAHGIAQVSDHGTPWVERSREIVSMIMSALFRPVTLTLQRGRSIVEIISKTTSKMNGGRR